LSAAFLVSFSAYGDVTMSNWIDSDQAPFGDVGHTFSWWQTIESYQAPSGAPQIDLSQYWLNVLIDGTIDSADGSPLVDDQGHTYSNYDHLTYSGTWAFELIDQQSGTGGIVQTGTFGLDAQWEFYDPFDPVSPIYATIDGTFNADSGTDYFPAGLGPVDFSGLRFDFTGVYDMDSALLRFTLVGNPELNGGIVPEPATSTLMAFGIVILVLRARRNHRRHLHQP